MICEQMRVTPKPGATRMYGRNVIRLSEVFAGRELKVEAVDLIAGEAYVVEPGHPQRVIIIPMEDLEEVEDEDEELF